MVTNLNLQQKQKILAWLGESESQNLRLPSECGKTQGENWKLYLNLGTFWRIFKKNVFFIFYVLFYTETVHKTKTVPSAKGQLTSTFLS